MRSSLVLWVCLAACGGGSGATNDGGTQDAKTAPGDAEAGVQVTPGQYGNPSGKCTVPSAALAEDVSSPTTVVGTGTAASCTGASVVAAVGAGGVVTFDCGSAPVTIVVPEIQIVNDGGKTADGSVTIDGGNKVTLSGNGANRIIYQNTCDQTLHYTTTHCQNQPAPHLVVQNIAFTAGSANATSSVLGGGALYVGGGTQGVQHQHHAIDTAEPRAGLCRRGDLHVQSSHTAGVHRQQHVRLELGM
jgi:hypothetical protein